MLDEPRVRDRNLLVRAAVEPAMAVGMIKEYPPLAAKAAALLVAVVRRFRPFEDGTSGPDSPPRSSCSRSTVIV